MGHKGYVNGAIKVGVKALGARCFMLKARVISINNQL